MQIAVSQVPKTGGQSVCRKCKTKMKRGALRMYVDMRNGRVSETGGYICEKCIPEFRNDVVDVIRAVTVVNRIRKGDMKLALLNKNSSIEVVRNASLEALSKE